MPRGPRPVAPLIPHHVIHRGNNRQIIFAEPDDYIYYLACLRSAKALYSCRIYAYVLMTNHVHLLVEPSGPTDLGRFMKRVAGRYTRYMNRKYGRTGTLWEGRFKSALVEGERYLLAVSRYIELNPVRAKLVSDPGEYRWSSYTAHASGDTDGTVDFDPWYQSLGTTAEERGKRYAAWVMESIPAGEWEAIRKSIQREGFVGDPRFKEQIEILLGRAVEMRAPGRPRMLEK